ncbi:MAG TPA: DNA translocase FtsK 4TM domain-containing protein, partial [Isosphaeraceae bacterium]
MGDRQRRGRRGQAWVLLFVWIFLALSLLGYDPADAPGAAAAPPNPVPSNPCGPVGAALAWALLQTIGWASALLLPALAALGVLGVRRRPVPEPGPRLVGFGLILAVTAALVQLASASLGRIPPVGGGGYLGALAVALLRGQFGSIGMALILAAGGVLGAALCHDVLVLWPIQELLRAGGFARRPPAPADPDAAEATLALSPARYEVAEPDRL